MMQRAWHREMAVSLFDLARKSEGRQERWLYLSLAKHHRAMAEGARGPKFADDISGFAAIAEDVMQDLQLEIDPE